MSSRDLDSSVVIKLAHWKGWGAPRESPEEELDVDPLEAVRTDMEALQVEERKNRVHVEVRETVQVGT